jgi:glycosyltransferase involved in cell wall biosynthesis
LKIGYSATIWDDSRSGIGTYIAGQLACLAQRSDVDVRPLEFGGRVLARGESPQTSGAQAGVQQKIRPLKDIWWHRHTLRSVAAREKFDVVHVPTIRRLPGLLPCGSVVTVHDLGPVRLGKKYGMLRGFYHQRIVPHWLRGVDAIVTPSQNTKNDLVEFYHADPSKITVVPNGVNHAFYHLGDTAESEAVVLRAFNVKPPFFVYVSRLEHPAKNHVRLLEAFARFKKKQRLPHKLVLAGAPWNGHEMIKAAATSLVASGDVVFADFVPRDQLPHLLRAADALIYPSLFEGFGIPIIEAMACGTPVACSGTSSLKEIGEGHGLLFDPMDVSSIADALTRIATDSDLREKLRREGPAYAKQFTWERSVEQTIAVWKKVAAQRQ